MLTWMKIRCGSTELNVLRKKGTVYRKQKGSKLSGLSQNIRMKKQKISHFILQFQVVLLI